MAKVGLPGNNHMVLTDDGRPSSISKELHDGRRARDPQWPGYSWGGNLARFLLCIPEVL